jgi:hypothetical protein
MQLSQLPGKQDQRAPRSAVALLPPDVLAQVIHAIGHDTHSTRTIVEWLRSEGHTSVTDGSLEYWIRNSADCPTRGSLRGQS